MRRGLLSHGVATCQSVSLPACSVLVKSCYAIALPIDVTPSSSPALDFMPTTSAPHTAIDDYSRSPAGVGSLHRSAGDPCGLGYFANNGLLGAGLYDLYWPPH